MPHREHLDAFRSCAHAVQNEKTNTCEHKPPHACATRPRSADVGILGDAVKRAIEFLPKQSRCRGAVQAPPVARFGDETARAGG